MNNIKLFWVGLILFEVPLFLGFCFWQGNILAISFAGFGMLTLVYATFSMSKNNQFLHQLEFIILFVKNKFYVVCILFGVTYLLVAIIRYISVQNYVGDIGAFGYEIAQFVKFKTLKTTILGRHDLADHFVPNLILFYPFFKIYSSFLWLTAFQVAAFLSSALVLIRIGKQVIPDDHDWLIYIAPALFLINNYVSLTVLWQIQPSAFSLPFILLAFSFAIDKKYVKMFIVLIFLLGFKENLALIWISLGMFLISHLNKIKLGICLIVMGTIFGLLIYFIIMPYFNDGSYPHHMGRFGPFALIPQKMFLITVSLISVGFLPLLTPKSLLYILPAFGLALVSKSSTMLTFDYHYQDIPLTVLFIGVIYGLETLATGKSWLFKVNKKYLEYMAAIVFIVIIFSNPRSPTLILKNYWPESEEILLFHEIKRYEKIAPMDVKHWVDARVQPYLINHPYLIAFHYDGWENALNDREPHIIVVPVQRLSKLAPRQFREFKKNMKIALSQGKYKTINNFNKLLIYRSQY